MHHKIEAECKNLDYMFYVTMPEDRELSFITELCTMLGESRPDTISWVRDQEGAARTLARRSFNIAKKVFVDKSSYKSSLPYMFAENGRERAMIAIMHGEGADNPLVQKVFDLRKKWLLETTEMELLFENVGALEGLGLK